jgi:HAD superfamily hydrolase (TIGR01509 family)
MSPTRFAGAIFDMDGTLVQSEHLHRKSWLKPLADLGIALDEDAYLRDFAGKPGLTIISDHIGLEGEAAVALYNRVTDTYWQIAVNEVEPTPGLLAFLERIAPLPMAVCTSAQRASADRMLDLLKLGPRFQAVVTSTDVSHGKPHPEPFLLAAERLHVPAGLCIAFEDSANGLISARKAGMYCVGIGFGATVYGQLADIWITDFTDPRLSQVPGL